MYENGKPHDTKSKESIHLDSYKKPDALLSGHIVVIYNFCNDHQSNFFIIYLRLVSKTTYIYFNLKITQNLEFNQIYL